MLARIANLGKLRQVQVDNCIFVSNLRNAYIMLQVCSFMETDVVTHSWIA